MAKRRKKQAKPYRYPTKSEIEQAVESCRLLRQEIERSQRLITQMMNMRFMVGCLMGRPGMGFDPSML
ncbi:MAG: hypothetical protein ABIB97_01110 [Patescibacteria group bacterium]